MDYLNNDDLILEHHSYLNQFPSYSFLNEFEETAGSRQRLAASN